MNLIVDESVDKQIVDRLRQDGCFVDYVAEMDPGITDLTVFDLANQNQALLLTADKDFGEIVFRQKQVSAGIILLRLSGLTPNKKRLLFRRLSKSIFRDLPTHFQLSLQPASASANKVFEQQWRQSMPLIC